VRVDNRIRVGRSLAVPAGRHALSVSVPGYVPRTDTMVLRAGETITWSPALTPEPPKQPVAAAPKPAAPAGPTCAASVQGEQWAAAFESCMRESLAGSAAAKRNLAQLYERGRGVERSEANAVRWYESAANGGDRDAMYQLATRYDRGRGVKKDAALALQWYTRAGDAGLLSAQLALGEIYEKGRLGVTKDKAKALDWYRKAAAQGSKDAADKVRDLSK
jgi:TPR repeat protein